MQFRVVIPEHVRAGQYIKVHCPPDGKGSQSREAELRVPKGLKPGDSFVFDISEHDSTITIANDVDLLNSQMAASAANNTNNNNNNNNAANNKQRSSNASSTSTTTNNNFLDREVLHLRDFLVALGIGLIIGISIVVGFVMGVLFATRGIPEAGPSSNAPSLLSGSPSSLHPHHHGGSPSSSMMMGGGDAGTIMGSSNDNSNSNNVGLYQLQSLAPNYGHHYQILYGGYSRNVPGASQLSSSHLRHEEL